ncbi:MAG: hypothetical protein RJA22_1642 [Verrucomicrobiota bacterium]
MRFPEVMAGLVLAWWLPVAAWAEAVKDREGAVRRDRSALEQDARWIYNDVEAGFAEARRTGKPLLVVLRCVPCLACAGLDAQVLLEETELAPLLERFVRVRLINANTLDLARFQFDYDLSFSTLFFNGDGTVYGRYGSWTHQTNAQDQATAGFRRALEGVLRLHGGYPGNRAALAGKQGKPGPFRTPLAIPTLAGKYREELDWNGKVVPSCVHCHQVTDALRLQVRNQREPMPDALLFPHPGPAVLGLVLAADAAARVEGVEAGSTAERAGLRVGDEIRELGGQPLVSAADVSWVLHGLGRSARLEAVVERSGLTRTVVLALPEGWRERTDISRRVGTWGMRGMATGGLVLEDLPDADRRARGLELGQLALRVKHVGEYGKHAAAKRAGFRKDDVLVGIESAPGVDLSARRLGEGELIAWILRNHPMGTQLRVRVWRDGRQLELRLPVQ